MKTTHKSLIVAAAMTGLFTGSTAFAAADMQAAAGVSVLAEKEKGNACKGQNACKGKGGCKTGDGGCKGKNSCKGKGGCKTEAPK